MASLLASRSQDRRATASEPQGQERQPKVGNSRISLFTPGARTAWHIHPLGQTIFVTEPVVSPATDYRLRTRRPISRSCG